MRGRHALVTAAETRGTMRYRGVSVTTQKYPVAPVDVPVDREPHLGVDHRSDITRAESNRTLQPDAAQALVPVDIDARRERWMLVRDVLVFQGKLFLDGLKDLVLAPVSAAAAVFGLVFERRRPRRLFFAVLRLGRTFDRHVNLFGSVEPDAATPEPSPGIDAQLRRLEALLVEQHRHGGLTAKAKDAIDRALDRLQDAALSSSAAIARRTSAKVVDGGSSPVSSGRSDG